MSEVFETLQKRYRDLVARSLAGAPDEAFMERLIVFLNDGHQAGAVLADREERSLLRAYMRFLATLLHQAGRDVPDVDLQPLDRQRWTPRPPSALAGPVVPPRVWALAGAAGLVVLAGLLVVAGLALGTLRLYPASTPPTPSPTVPPPTPPTATPTLTPTPTSTPTPQPTSPRFSDLTVALGMLSPTEPFLVGDAFDWNTRAVYAAFDYADMEDGLAWSVQWSREGEEIARENHLWDVERDDRSGTLWAAYHNPDGTVLRGGNYTVTLRIENTIQAAAPFRIRVYVPPSPTP
jgi:hypothetical protein